jgi:hypothetical protein
MQRYIAFLTGVTSCVVVAMLAARQPSSSGSNQSRGERVNSEPRDSGDLSSLSVYDPNPNHLWNRLFRQFYVRKAWDEREYGGDVLDPPLWKETHYLVSGPSHRQATKILDEFLSTRGERLISDPLKRAMLQRDLWAVFDWLADRWTEESKSNTAELERKLAQVIQRLALSSEQIQALPDTYSLAVGAKALPAEYDANRRKTTFLPPDLLQPRGAWVNVGGAGERGVPAGLGAPVHSREFGARSLFLVFLRLPGGRDATLPYIKQLADFPKPCIRNPDEFYLLTRNPITGAGAGSVDANSQPVPNPDLPQFPPGTEVLLLRRMMLIDREGQLRPTNIVESIQIRIFVDIVSRAEWLDKPSKFIQDVFELMLSRRKLLAGEAGGLRAISNDDRELSTFLVQGFDGFELQPREGSGMGTQGNVEHRGSIVLDTCVHCHGAPGVQSLAAARTLFGPGACTAVKFCATSPEEQAEETMDWKRRQYDWGLLQGLWISSADQVVSGTH